MAFWPALFQTRLYYDAFVSRQPDVFKQMLLNVVMGMALVAPEALAVNLDTLCLVCACVGLVCVGGGHGGL
jgi:hypothetical protein